MSLAGTISSRLSVLLDRADTILAARTSSDFQGRAVYYVSRPDAIGWATNVSSLLQRSFGNDSIHFKAFEQQLSKFRGYESDFRNLRAVLAAAREDFDGGFLFTVQSLVKAEVLGDAFEQAQELLRAGYKDPACVLIGVSLEVGIKDLAARHGVPVGKLDKMNADLAKAGVYNVAKQKQITAWADLRNKAAHGEWSAYSQADVDDMYRGVERFVADYLQ